MVELKWVPVHEASERRDEGWCEVQLGDVSWVKEFYILMASSEELAQPEPAAPVEMPEAVRNALGLLPWNEGHALGEWWRTHSQPVGITEELERVLSFATETIADERREADRLWNDGYFKQIESAISAVRSQYGRKG